MHVVTEAVPSVDSIAMADNNCVVTTKIGALSGIMVDKNGNELSHLKLSEVSFAPAAAYNLFSVSKRVNEGWTLKSELTTDGDTSLVLERNGARIVFDIKIETPKGAIYCMRMKRKMVPSEAGATSLNNESRIMPPSKPKVKFNINHAHQLYGYYDEPTTRQAVYARGIGIVRGTLKPSCNHCAMAKSKQRHVPAIEPQADCAVKPNDRDALDISTIKAPKALKITLGKPNWRIMVDELTGMKFSDFFATKNGMVEPTCEKLNMWKEAKIPVTYLRMDNAGENKALHTRMNSADGVYKIWNPNTNRIIVSRDIIWMRRMYYKPADGLDDEVGGDMDKGLVTSVVENDDDDNDKDVDEDKDADTEEDANMDAPARAPAAAITTRSGRVVSQHAAMMMASKAEYADGEVAAIGIDINEVACVGMGTGSAFKNTSKLKVLKLDQALGGPDKEHWEKAVEEEYHRMKKS